MPVVAPLPKMTQAIVPYLMVQDAAKAIDFYKKAFAAQEMYRLPAPDGKGVMHAELQIAGCMVYLSDMCCDQASKKPEANGYSTMGLTVYCLDADKVFQRALDSGAKVMKPLSNEFWGDRMGTVIDPFGHAWTLLQRIEEVPASEMAQRAQKAMAKAKGKG